MEEFKPYEFMKKVTTNRPYNQHGVRDTDWMYVHVTDVEHIITKLVDRESTNINSLASKLDVVKKKLASYTHSHTEEIKSARDEEIHELNERYWEGDLDYDVYIDKFENIKRTYDANMAGISQGG